MHQSLAVGVTLFVVLLAVALLVSIAAERVRIPAAVLLVAAGAAFGSVWHVGPPFAFSGTLLFVFLPPLIFEGAWTLDVRALRRAAVRVVVLAVPGTVLSAFVVAGALVVVGALPFGAALLLGAMIAATDPIAVISVFRSAAVPQHVRTIVEAESLSNDGVAVVLYGIALALASGGTVAWLPAIAAGALSVLAGIAIGMLVAVAVWLLFRLTRAAEYEVTATIALAYLAYLLADSLHCSGIFATAAGAIALRWLLQRATDLDNPDHVDVFWNSSAYIANATVFLATGLSIDVPRALHEPALVVAAIAGAAVSRGLLTPVAARDPADRITFFMAGMRGALPLALALALPADLPQRPQLIDGVFAVVLVTLILQGAPLEPIVRRLYRNVAAAGALAAGRRSSAG